MTGLGEKYRSLAWDTDFFGLEVGRLDIDSIADAEWLFQMGGCEAGDGVCYLFVDPSINNGIESKLELMGAVHYGSRVVYNLNPQEVRSTAGGRVRVIDELNDRVYELAIAAGHCSRFSQDPRFSGKFEALYRTWIEKCFKAKANGEGEVFGIVDGGDLNGIVAVSLRNSSIELIAVDAASRAKGYGRQLINAAINYAADAGHDLFKVVTQGQNFSGCRAYKACGFAESGRTEIWHLPTSTELRIKLKGSSDVVRI